MIDYRLGDSIAGLEAIPKGAVDLVLTDPPYGNIGGGGKTRSAVPGFQVVEGRTRDGSGVRVPGDREWEDLMKRVGPELTRVAAKDAWAVIFTEPKALRGMWGAMEAAGWKYRSIIIWEKPNLSFNLGIRRQYEMLLIMRRGSPRCGWEGGDIIKSPIVVGRVHPTQKPNALLRKLVADFSPDMGLVLDPFAGVGTSLIAAADEGRRGIGWEIDEEFHNLGLALIEQAGHAV